jgi:hypothetical protein
VATGDPRGRRRLRLAAHTRYRRCRLLVEPGRRVDHAEQRDDTGDPVEIADFGFDARQAMSMTSRATWYRLSALQGCTLMRSPVVDPFPEAVSPT